MAKEIRKNPKFSINLLPEEFSVRAKQQQKFVTVQTFSVMAILVMIFLSSTVVVLRILQSQKINSLTSNTTYAESRVSELKDKESSLTILKNRLDLVNQIINSPSKQSSTYLFVTKAIPADASLGSMTVDGTGSLSLSATCPDNNCLGRLLASLSNPEAFKVISRVDLDSMSKGKDGSIRISLKVVPK